MRVWLVRAGKRGEDEDLALTEGVAVVGFRDIPDLTNARSREEIAALCAQAMPGATKATIGAHVGQLFAFRTRITCEDLVVLPRKSAARQIAIGQPTGEYAFRLLAGERRHTRAVRWLRTDVPRTAVKQDLLYSLGAFSTVCQIERNGARERFQAISEGRTDPGPGDGPGGDDTDGTDTEQLARDQIVQYIGSHFAGHALAALVDAVLRAEGYLTELSTPGPDGGVDILAGRGSLGLDRPRLCVQVKSSASPADVTTFRALQGSMQTFQADQGLLVSWGGFTAALDKEARVGFFAVRLWDADDLVDALFRNYDKLTDDLQAELPLKRIWALVPEEGQT